MLLTMSGSCISCNIMQEPTTSNIMHEVPLEAVFLHLEHSRSSSPLSLSLKKKKDVGHRLCVSISELVRI